MQIWIEGETSPRLYTLKVNDEPQDLTGATVTMLVKDGDGQPVTFAGSVIVTDADSGVVQFTPTATDLKVVEAPYSVLWKVTFVSSAISYFPSTGADYWQVRDLWTPFPFMTFGQARKQILRWLDGIESYETGDSLDEMVKQQVQESNYQRTTEYPWWFMKTQVPATINGSSRMPLPGNMRSLRGIWSPSCNDYLAHIPDRMVDVYGPNSARQGTNGRTPYVIEGTFIRFLAAPASETVTVHYFRTPTFMEQPDDLSDLPFPHTRILVWDSLLDLKSYTRESEDRALWTQKQAMAEKVLYESQKDGDILGGMTSTIKPGSEMR